MNSIEALDKCIINGLLINSRPGFQENDKRSYPGYVVQRMDEATRNALKELTSNDLKRIRPDAIFGLG